MPDADTERAAGVRAREVRLGRDDADQQSEAG